MSDTSNLSQVRVTKLESLPGKPNGEGPLRTITEGYTITGVEVLPPAIGYPYTVVRSERNGEKVHGIFQTSVIIDIDTEENTIKTQNSVYRIETL
jgi:hypothetical protein